MADMCGPSNALANFQKHTAVDRTLQQDRLISRQPGSQGFRSAPGPNARQLDHEFEAFQAGALPLENGFQQQRPGFPQQGFQTTPGPANWASDFQRMNISSPVQQQYQPQAQGGQIQQGHDTGAWHQDFAQQNKMAGPIMQAEQQGGFMQRYPTMSGGYGMNMGHQFGGYAGPQQAQMQSQSQAEQFDEEAFARAFDEAAKAELDQQGIELGQDIMIEESAERLMSSEDLSRPLDQEPIGADTIHDPTKPLDQQPKEEPDALAKTAARLLDSVSHDQSDKMKGSMFLELMRQFRDGDSGIQGTEVVDRDGKATDGGSGMTESNLQVP